MDPHNPMIEKLPAPKLCKDCRHAQPFKALFCKADWSLGMCKAPQNMTIDLTDGLPLAKRIAYCSVHRISTEADACGRDGKWWEPK